MGWGWELHYECKSPKRPEEETGSLGAGLCDDFKIAGCLKHGLKYHPSRGCWETNSDRLQEQCMVSTAEASLHLQGPALLRVAWGSM